jgi:hypothetical protein
MAELTDSTDTATSTCCGPAGQGDDEIRAGSAIIRARKPS